jgi:hypothetical protein
MRSCMGIKHRKIKHVAIHIHEDLNSGPLVVTIPQLVSPTRLEDVRYLRKLHIISLASNFLYFCNFIYLFCPRFWSSLLHRYI